MRTETVEKLYLLTEDHSQTIHLITTASTRQTIDEQTLAITNLQSQRLIIQWLRCLHEQLEEWKEGSVQ